MEDVSIQQEEILKKIRSLRRGAAAGPDGIGPAFLQDYHKALVPALQVLFRKVLDEGVAPVGWRQANVTPIFKKGSKSDPGNYRPVSLTSVTCKVFESILRDNIVNHLESNKLLNASQHGFMRGKSCTTNLVEYLDLVTRALDEGKAMDTVFLDFAKAFDKVPTRRLLAKLEAHGVEGKVHRWIAAWLENREQRVVLNGEASTWSKVLSGVPQGSVLGPILFLIFINDIDQQVGRNTTIKKFADDTKLGKLIESNQDNILFQTCLDKLVDWADTWGMAFNISKCKVMHMGKNNTQYPYTMGGQLLKKTTSERDVGITVDNSGKPESQCAKAAKTASVVLGQISRAFSYRDKKTFIRLYVQYVRPHLEFACQAWSPWTTKDVETLEKVQQRAVKMVGGLKGSTYEEKLVEIGIPSLADRRKEADLMLAYKVLNGYTKVAQGEWFRRAADMTAAHQTRSTTDEHRLLKPKARLELRRNSYLVRVVDDWNALPATTKSTKTVSAFKIALRLHMAQPSAARGPS